jgi:hypothetical protein
MVGQTTLLHEAGAAFARALDGRLAEIQRHEFLFTL